ncbi:MAG: FG-GAP-like repeat-containing protein, partial [Candidatus Neomarinimicrobiota bacterium]
SWVDLNKDGYLDLVVSGYNDTPQINIYISQNNAQYFELSENDYGLPELFASKMAWGDLDNDGDMDLAITGINAENNSVFDIYYREDNKDNFIKENEFNNNSDQLENGYLEIVDIDLDGDNDIKFPGGIILNSFFRSNNYQNNNNYSYYDQSGKGYGSWDRPHKNSSLAFIKLSSNRLDFIEMGDTSEDDLVSNSNYFGFNIGLRNGDIAVGDYDNNGYDDIVITGEDVNGVPLTKLYEGLPNYDGAGNTNPTWVESPIELVGLRESTANWVDYDMDGDLDLFITGLDSSGAKTILYETEIRNKDNQAPPKVTGLKAEDLGNGKIKFTWEKPTDDFSDNIGYVFRLGKTPGGTELSNTFSNLETGNRLITLPPPIYSTFYETILEPGTYYFAVQAIDGGLKAGEFSQESTFTLKYDWKLLNQGGIVDRTISGWEDSVMKIGDIDNDNDLDLIYGSSTRGYNTQVYKYDGKKLIRENNNNISLRNITDIDVGDINSDGLSDVVLNSFNGDNVLYAYFGNENGGMNSVYIDNGLYNGKVKIIDMNNDGQSEVVLIGLTADNTSGKPKIFIYELNENNQFEKVDISNQIDDLTGASYDLGDVDNDQDIDIIISGFDESQGLRSYIYKNVGNAGLEYKLEKTNNNIAAIRDGTVDFIDFDSDGDLDAAVTGTGLQGDIFEIYKNDLNEGKENWPRIELGLTGMRNGKVDLGDFNGDGYTDIIYSGLLEGSGKVTNLAEYSPESRAYADSAFDVSDIIEASVEFGDIDGDGDLDFILSGQDKENSSNIFRAYLNKRNESALVTEPQSGSRAVGKSNENSYVENAPPSVPEIISTEILLSEQTVEGNLVIEFSWNASSDDLTPVEGLTYALKIGTTENGEEIMSANSNANGQRKTAEKGNAEHNLKWKVSLPDGVYYWSVQAIDASYNGSEFSKPRQFLASADFKLGDSNGDQSVNILDLTNIIDKILGNDVSVWINTTSDINNDGVIDVLDVSGVVNLILNSNESGLAYGVDPGRNLNYFSTVPVGEMELVYSGNKVYFESEEVISGLQFTINKSIDHLINKDLSENLNIISLKEDDNNITYIIYSNDNQSIAEYSNILLSYVDKKLKEYEISDIKAATPDGLPLIVKYKDESFFDEENEILKVYPNPTQNNLNILGSIVNDLNIIDVKIYNTIGIMVYEESFDSIERFRQLDLSSLISGVYVIEINTILGKNIKKSKVYKFVKN